MKNKYLFVVVGRLGKSLIYQKVVPFINSRYFYKVLIFSQDKGYYIKGAEYITIPKSLKNIKTRKIKNIIIRIYEPLQLLIYTLKYKPEYINGIFTIPKGLNAFLVGKLTKTKSIISVIGGNVEIDTYKKPQFFWKGLNLFMINKCSICTTVGTKVIQYLIENGINKNKIFIYPGYVDINKYNDNNSIRDIDILFVGTFRKLKGPDRIVDMIKILIKNIPNLKAVFLGSGYLFEEVEKKIKQLNLEKNIKLLGFRDDTYKFYRKSKLLVMPSRSEGLSMAMLEAMACGCVPVVSNVGNMTDAAFDGVNAFVIEDYRDINSFVVKIKELLENEEKRFEMAKNAKELINNKYSLVPQTQIVKKIIEYGETL